MRTIFRKQKFTSVPIREEVGISLKGVALLDAIGTGLIHETEDGNGYDIGPFLRFWDEFSPLLPADVREYRPDEIKNLTEMIEKQRNETAQNGTPKA